mmetsp:Transcript_769/g.1616  ORF Transcript_769/g.1616 Transcript_769/m.1616 type:complete len:200 (-) Transcript_769:485-1084(-)
MRSRSAGWASSASTFSFNSSTCRRVCANTRSAAFSTSTSTCTPCALMSTSKPLMSALGSAARSRLAGVGTEAWRKLRSTARYTPLDSRRKAGARGSAAADDDGGSLASCSCFCCCCCCCFRVCRTLKTRSTFPALPYALSKVDSMDGVGSTPHAAMLSSTASSHVWAGPKRFRVKLGGWLAHHLSKPLKAALEGWSEGL